MAPNRRAFWLRLAFAALLVAGAAAFLAFKPASLKLPSCTFRRITGLYCPGCGSTRALTRLVHGDVAGAFRYNPLAGPTLLFVGLLFFVRLHELWTGRLSSGRLTAFGGLVFLLAFIASMILRNIPWSGFDWLRPPG